jgi:NAD+ kinase
MNESVQNILVVTKAGDAEAAALGREIGSWLEGRGLVARVMENRQERGREEAARAGVFDPRPDLVLVLGGDGSMIGVARKMVEPIPMLGLNLGKVGFLTELGRADWEGRLSTILDKGFRTARRMALAYTVRRQGREILTGRIINDLVVNRGSLARLIHVNVSADGEPLGVLRADGLIVATPTGTTGYAVSAGGPLVMPELEVYTLTAVCPFRSTFRPLVLSSASELLLHILESKAETFLTVDGQEGFPLACGDEVLVRRSQVDLLFADPGGPGYLAKLRTKGFIRGEEA